MKFISRSLLVDTWSVMGWRLPVLVALTFSSAILEGATVASLLPLLSSLSGSSSPSTDRVLMLFKSVFGKFGVLVTPEVIAVLIIILILASAAIFLIQSYLASRLQSLYSASWQRRMLAVFLEADYSFFQARRSGDLTAAITNEPVRVGLVFSQANLIIAAILFIIVQIVISMFIAPIVVGLVFLFGAVLFLVTRRWARRARDFGTDFSKVNASLIADVGEILAGVKFVKATATEDRAISRLSVAVDQLERLTHSNAFDGQVVKAIFEYSGGLLVVLLLFAGPMFFAVDVGAILVIVAIFVRLFPKVTGLRQSLQIVDFHMPAFDAALRLLSDARAHQEQSISDVPIGWPEPIPASISIDGLSVIAGSRTILDGVTIDIPSGAFVALVGQTGSGKTTLVDCILGLRSPSAGVVRVDGFPLGQLSNAAWRRGVGYLGQDPVLFNSSIRDNLRWIRPDTTDQEMLAALKAAAASQFVERLPLGLDTIVGEHGGRLSGGERQRIALARALLGSPRLLVLDEATSALDLETEEIVATALSKLKRRLTIIAITHRPALLREADLVITLDEGKADSSRRGLMKGSTDETSGVSLP
jgi:ATP-binding cassette subfamily C protein